MSSNSNKSKRIGRPSKLTPELIEKLSSYVRDGNYFITACQACRISKNSLYSWLNKAEDDLENGRESLYTNLMDSLKKAESDAEAEMVEIVRGKAKNDKEWLPAMTYLERRHPERWGRKDRTHITVDEHKQVTITHVEIIKDYGQSGQIVEGESREIKEIPESTELDHA
jgi:pyruvate/2-oxoacid:ferredoxin oxidoreductase beta subunit